MIDIITTLHPENDENTNLYPNIKKENIPNGSIDLTKLSDNVKSLLNNIGELHPSGVDTSTNILAFTTDKGIWIGSDTGHWYYWNGSQYVDGGVYQATAIADGSITTEKLNNDCLIKYPYLNGVDLDTIKDLGRYIAVGCTNTPTNNTYFLEIQRYKTASENTADIVQLARKYDTNDYVLYYRVFVGSWSKWYSVLDSKNTFEDINFIDNSKITDNKLINWTNGNTSDNNDYRCYEEYIPVIEGGNYYVGMFNENGGLNIDNNYALLGAYYDENYNYLDEIYVTSYDTCRGGTLVNNYFNLTLPTECKYVRLSFRDSDNNLQWQMSLGMKELSKSNTIKTSLINKLGILSGKTIINFGDSIIGNTQDNTSVSSYIAESGANVHNIGFGGCQMSKHATNWDLCSMYNLADAIANNDFTALLTATNTGWSGMPSYFKKTAIELSEIDFSKVDVITISYGTNDYREGDSIVGNQINLFDNDFDESGFINTSNGEEVASSGYMRTSKYYPIKSVSNLYLRLSDLTPTFVVLFYDFNGNYLGYSSHNSGDLTYTLSVPNNAVCYRIYVDASYSSIACISYEPSSEVIPYFNNEDVIDCLKYSIRKINASYPKIKILVTTPIYRSFLNSNNEVLTNSDVMDFGGGTLEDYSKAYIDACKELKILCLDLYHISGLNKESRDYYYPIDDGTHPNEKGRKVIADLISSKIIEIVGD